MSNFRVEVSSNSVYTVTGVAEISWEVVIVARWGIGVLKGATSDSKIVASFSVFVTRTSILLGSVLSGAVSAL